MCREIDRECVERERERERESVCVCELFKFFARQLMNGVFRM